MVIWIIASVVVLIVLAVAMANSVRIQNDLIVKRERIKESGDVVCIQLQQRHDLFAQMVGIVSSSVRAQQEYVLLFLREQGLGRAIAPTAGDQDIDSFIQNIVAKRIPNNIGGIDGSSFVKWQEQVTETERDISGAKRSLVQSLREYNQAIQMFPTSVVAARKGFARIDAVEPPPSLSTLPTELRKLAPGGAVFDAVLGVSAGTGSLRASAGSHNFTNPPVAATPPVDRSSPRLRPNDPGRHVIRGWNDDDSSEPGSRTR